MKDIDKLLNMYTFRVFWSKEDQEYVGVCDGFGSLSFLDPDRFKAFEGVVELVKDVLTDLAKNEELVKYMLSFEKKQTYKPSVKAQKARQKKEDEMEEKLKETTFYKLPNELDWAKPVLHHDIDNDMPPVLRPKK